jgi:hypothetical protein
MLDHLEQKPGAAREETRSDDLTLLARVDHVVIGARGIEQVAPLLRDQHGFGVVRGSAHLDGTQGWLVPFDTPRVQYLEILTPSRPEVLSGSEFGRAFLDRTAAGPAFLTWAVLSTDIERDAERVHRLSGTDPGLLRGESVRADGRHFPWAEAGFAQSWERPSRPFFLQYGNWPDRSARVAGDVAQAGHRVTPVEFAEVDVVSTGRDPSSWWAPYRLPVVVEPGDRDGVRAVRIRTTGGDAEVVLP